MNFKNPKLAGGTKVILPDGTKSQIVSTYYKSDGSIHHLCFVILKIVTKNKDEKIKFYHPISFSESALKVDKK